MNIFEIKTALLNIFRELEDNEGELTPEIQAELDSTQADLKDKVEGFTDYIKVLDNNVNLIDSEIARLKKLKESKNKTIERLKKILVDIVQEFGDVNKSGTKYIDYGTGKLSIRKSTTVDVDDEVADTAVYDIFKHLRWLREANQLDTIYYLNQTDILKYLSEEKLEHDGTITPGISLTPEDIENLNTEFTFKFPISGLFKSDGYNLIKNLIEYTNAFKVKSNIDKLELKKKLIENGASTPNLAKLNTNYNLVIK